MNSELIFIEVSISSGLNCFNPNLPIKCEFNESN